MCVYTWYVFIIKKTREKHLDVMSWISMLYTHNTEKASTIQFIFAVCRGYVDRLAFVLVVVNPHHQQQQHRQEYKSAKE